MRGDREVRYVEQEFENAYRVVFNRELTSHELVEFQSFVEGFNRSVKQEIDEADKEICAWLRERR